ncbi:HdeD family acid-resistance protein [Lachnotalea glycerini]|uniref:DUF308 domain-containing protein n=1 Tax=Lachnotalea glycerini TaxID=1763509 RepID=A0A371JFI9_9FIRM|nr:DUF308 domain-containing protein [Lachnotalea glycerini]RDY31501.1 hypothetical protein CG710_009100 [Lachnotalea glycerini]
MERVLKNTKVSIALTAILNICLGITLLVYPKMTMTAICYAFGGVLIICALFHVFFYFKYKKQNSLVNFNIIIAIVTGVIGIWIVSKPSMVIYIIPVIFGFVLVIHSIVNVKQGIELKEKFYQHWWISFFMAVIHIGFASLLFINPFQAETTLMIAIGISLLYDGISSIWILSRIGKAEREIKKSLYTLNTLGETYIDEKL